MQALHSSLRTGKRTIFQALTFTLLLALVGWMNLSARAQATANLHRFYAINNDPAEAYEGAIQAKDGNFYGVSFTGGAYGEGTVYKVNGLGAVTVLHSFGNADGTAPYASLTQGSDGNFYGTTSFGGQYGSGTIFRISVTGKFTVLYHFLTNESDHYSPLIQANDGNFYGVTGGGGLNGYGTIFRMDPKGHVTLMHSFDLYTEGSQPILSLLGKDGDLYGLTSAPNSSVFRMDTSGNFAILHTFTLSEGNAPSALIQGNDGNLYATNEDGGAHFLGAILRIDLQGNTTLLYSFQPGLSGPSTIIQASDGNLYGLASHSIWRLDASNQFTSIHTLDYYLEGGGFNAYGTNYTLIEGQDGYLYVTAPNGGPHNYGTLFRTDKTGTNYTTFYAFNYEYDGNYPQGGLILAKNGDFYGVTGFGGQFGYGTIYKAQVGGRITTLHDFNGLDGFHPVGITAASDGNFYGLTQTNGSNYPGVAFRCGPDGTFTVLNDQNIFYPTSPLIQGQGGFLYGSCQGGPSFPGTILFKMDTTGTFTPLHSLNYATEGTYASALLRTSDGSLYGSTQYAGLSSGTLFRLDPQNNFAVLHSFTGYNSANPVASDGAEPYSALIQDGQGNLYGTTYMGGANNAGTAYQLDTVGNYSVLHSFGGSEGSNPVSALTLAKDGYFYGTTTSGGAHGLGAIFRMDTAGNVTVMCPLDYYATGYYSNAGLVQAADGKLYGVTALGGGFPAARHVGNIFWFDPKPRNLTDVSAQVSILIGPTTYQANTDSYVGSIQLTNAGSTTLRAPLQVVLHFQSAGIELADATGMLSSDPYYTVSTSLAPGASLRVPVRFINSGGQPISYTLTVYSGLL